MNKQSTSAGSIGFLGRIRSLLAFRHHNPVARLVSILVAFAIATLLVAGNGAAVADDSAPAPAPDTSTTTSTGATTTDTSTATPTDTTSATPTDTPKGTSPTPADTTATTDATPKSDTTPSTASTSTAPAASGTDTSGSGPIVRTLKKLTASPAAASPSLCGSQVSPVLVGTFEIDGNTCVDTSGKVDWDSNVAGMLYNFDDAKDTTAYTQGDSESSDPATWHTGGSSQGKDDITDAWSYTNIISNDVWTFFGVQRVSDNGTTTYDVELNHNANSPHEQTPNRTPAVNGEGGDLLLQFAVNGTGPLTFDKAYQWTAKADFNSVDCFEADSIGFGWCPLNTVTPPDFESSHSTDGLFAEGAVNLSALAQANGETCTGSFGWMNIRTVASESHTAALQDYVLPFPTNIQSTCGSLTIEKVDENGDPAPGATFTISSDPRPGHTGAVTVRDGSTLPTAQPGTTAIADPDGTANGEIAFSVANPGSYTVTEVSPPSSSYMIDNPLGTSTNPQSTSAGNPAVFHFVDHHIWKNLTATKTATTSYGASYDWSVVKEISADGSTGWDAGTTALNPLEKVVPDNATDANKLFYRVSVTAVGPPATSAYKVSGDITVSNPADNVGDMTATVSDSLTGATCTVGASHLASVDVNVAKGGSTPVPYECTFAATPTAGQMAGDNTASVTWNRKAYPQVPSDLSASDTATRTTVDPVTAPYDFANAVVAPENKTVTVTDNRVNNQDPFNPSWTLNWDDVYAMPGHTAVSPVYSVTVASAGSGTCSNVVDNTVTVTGNGIDPIDPADDHVFPPDSAYGQICQGADLTASMDASESLTRTFPWSVQKATTTPTVTVANGVATATYNVTVTTGDGADSNWLISGAITVTNPNVWEDIPLTGLTVSYSGSNDAVKTDDCVVAESLVAPIPQDNGSRVFHYTCTFAQQPDYTGTVDAAITWDATAAATPHGSPTPATSTAVATNEWAVTEVDHTITVHDDRATGQDIVIGTLDWPTVFAMDGHTTVISYSVDLTDLPSAGTCSNKVNTVWIIGHDGIHLDADSNASNNQATVQVCTPAIIVSPPQVSPPSVLPNTGGPALWPLVGGLALLLGGSGLVLADGRRRRRS